MGQTSCDGLGTQRHTNVVRWGREAEAPNGGQWWLPTNASPHGGVTALGTNCILRARGAEAQKRHC